MSPGRGNPGGLGISMTGPKIRLGWKAMLLVWAVRGLWAAGRTLIRHPWLPVAGAAVCGIWWTIAHLGRWSLLVLGLPLLLTCVAAYWVPTPRVDRWMRAPFRSSWRRASVYQRRWRSATTSAGLARTVDGDEQLPVLCRVTATGAVDAVTVRMLAGQTVEDWAKAAPRLAQTFGVRDLRATEAPGRVHEVQLRALRRDPLTALVPVPQPVDDVDLAAVPVGLREDGAPLTLPLLYSHLLIGGETGSGKGSVIWSLIAGVAPAVRQGRVRLWVIDPKGGVELAAGEALFDRFCHGGPEDAAALLEQAVVGMRSRAARMRGSTRKLVPSPSDPLIVVVIDELASLTAYVSDPKVRRRITDALSLLLSQGRAVGVTVVAATQDVRKEVVGMRDLFPVRVALRAAESEQADMLLGRGARDRGALTDRISHRLPGVGYVVVDGVPESVRARFAHVTDARIDAVVRDHAPRPVAAAPATP